MMETYQEVLGRLIKQIDDEGYDVRAKWSDEHGGQQSICHGVTLSVEEKK